MNEQAAYQAEAEDIFGSSNSPGVDSRALPAEAPTNGAGLDMEPSITYLDDEEDQSPSRGFWGRMKDSAATGLERTKQRAQETAANLPWRKAKAEIARVDEEYQRLAIELEQVQQELLVADGSTPQYSALEIRELTLQNAQLRLEQTRQALQYTVEQSLMAHASARIEACFQGGKAKWLKEMAGYSFAGAVVGAVAGATFEALPPTVKKSIGDAIVLSGFTVAGLATAGEVLQHSNNDFVRAVGTKLHQGTSFYFANFDRIAGFGVGFAAGSFIGSRAVDGLTGLFDSDGAQGGIAPEPTVHSSDADSGLSQHAPTPESTPTLSPVQAMTISGTPTPTFEPTPTPEPTLTPEPSPEPTPTGEVQVAATAAVEARGADEAAPSSLLARASERFFQIFGPLARQVEQNMHQIPEAAETPAPEVAPPVAESAQPRVETPAVAEAAAPESHPQTPEAVQPSTSELIARGRDLFNRIFQTEDGKLTLRPEYQERLEKTAGNLSAAVAQAQAESANADPSETQVDSSTQPQLDPGQEISRDAAAAPPPENAGEFTAETAEHSFETVFRNVYAEDLTDAELRLVKAVSLQFAADKLEELKDFPFAELLGKTQQATNEGVTELYTVPETGEDVAVLSLSKSAMEQLFDAYEAASAKPESERTSTEQLLIAVATGEKQALLPEEHAALFGVIAPEADASSADSSSEVPAAAEAADASHTANERRVEQVFTNVLGKDLTTSEMRLAKAVSLQYVSEDLGSLEGFPFAELLEETRESPTDAVIKTFADPDSGKPLTFVSMTKPSMERLFASFEAAQGKPPGDLSDAERLLIQVASGEKVQLTTDEHTTLLGMIAPNESNAAQPAAGVESVESQSVAASALPPSGETSQPSPTRELTGSIWGQLQQESGLPNRVVDVAKDIVLGTLPSSAEGGGKIDASSIPAGAQFLELTEALSAADVQAAVNPEAGVYGVLPSAEQQENLQAALQALDEVPAAERNAAQVLLQELASGEKLGQDLETGELDALFAVLRGEPTETASQLLGAEATPSVVNDAVTPDAQPVATEPVSEEVAPASAAEASDTVVDVQSANPEHRVTVQSGGTIQAVAAQMSGSLPEGIQLSPEFIEEQILLANEQANNNFEIRNVQTGDIVGNENIHPGDEVRTTIRDGKLLVEVHRVHIEQVREQQGRWDGAPIVGTVEVDLPATEGQPPSPMMQPDGETSPPATEAAQSSAVGAPAEAVPVTEPGSSVASEPAAADSAAEQPSDPQAESAEQQPEPEEAVEQPGLSEVEVRELRDAVLAATGLSIQHPEPVGRMIEYYASNTMGQGTVDALKFLEANPDTAIKLARVTDAVWNQWESECAEKNQPAYNTAPTSVRSPVRALVIAMVQRGENFPAFSVMSGADSVQIGPEDTAELMTKIGQDPTVASMLLGDNPDANGGIAQLNQQLFFGTDASGVERYKMFVNPVEPTVTSPAAIEQATATVTTTAQAEQPSATQEFARPSNPGEMPLAANRSFLFSPESLEYWSTNIPDSAELQAQLSAQGFSPEDASRVAEVVTTPAYREILQAELSSMAQALFPGQGGEPNLQAINEFRSKFGIEGEVTPRRMTEVAFALMAGVRHGQAADGSYIPLWDTTEVSKDFVQRMLEAQIPKASFDSMIQQPNEHFTYTGNAN